MTMKSIVIALILVAAVVLMALFGVQFARNQKNLASPPEIDRALMPDESDSAVSEDLPSSTIPDDIQSELEELDLSDLDAELDDLGTQAQGL